jgi:hypothetical protein
MSTRFGNQAEMCGRAAFRALFNEVGQASLDCVTTSDLWHVPSRTSDCGCAAQRFLPTLDGRTVTPSVLQCVSDARRPHLRIPGVCGHRSGPGRGRGPRCLTRRSDVLPTRALADLWSNVQITAAVLRDRAGRYEIEDVTLADPGPGQILCALSVWATVTPTYWSAPRTPAARCSGGWARGIRDCGDRWRLTPSGIAVAIMLCCPTIAPSVRQLPSGHPAYCDSFVRRNFGDARARVPAVMHDKHWAASVRT